MQKSIRSPLAAIPRGNFRWRNDLCTELRKSVVVGCSAATTFLQQSVSFAQHTASAADGMAAQPATARGDCGACQSRIARSTVHDGWRPFDAITWPAPTDTDSSALKRYSSLAPMLFTSGWLVLV